MEEVGFQNTTSIFDNDQGFQDKSKKERTLMLAYRLCERLDIEDGKKEQLDELYDRVNVTSLEKSSGSKGLDLVVLAGSLVHVVSRQAPVSPRWIKLVASECSSLSTEMSRPAYTYSNGYRGHWRKSIKSIVSNLKKNQGFDLAPVLGIDYMVYVLKRFDVDRSVETFCLRRMSLFEHDPRFQSKSRVPLSAALIHIGCEFYGSKSLDLEGLSEDLCVQPETVEEYREFILEELDIRGEVSE